MTIKRKKILFILIGLVCIFSLSLSSIAFLTSKDTITNHFKVAKYDITTKEDFEQTKEWKTNPIKKEVWIENTGTLPAYVRVKVVPFWKNGLPITLNGKDTVSLEFENSTKWIKIGDFYYYKKILNPGEKTENLLKDVKVNKDIKNIDKNYDISNLLVDVFTESIVHVDETKENQKDINKDRIKETWGINESDIL